MPLYIWRTVYPVSDLAAIFLVALAILLFAAVYAPTASKYRARLSIEVRDTSPLSKLLTGRLHAVFIALVFIALAIPVLAWQALTASSEEVIGLAVLCLVTSTFSLVLHGRLRSHLSPWLARSAAITLGALTVAVIFVPLIIWINWNYAVHSGEIRTATFIQSVTISIDELPSRRGWIAEILSVFYALDGAKFWLVVQNASSRWAAILYSLDTALVSFVVAQTSAYLANSISGKIEELRK